MVSLIFVDFSRAERTHRAIVCMRSLANPPPTSRSQPFLWNGWPLLPSLMF